MDEKIEQTELQLRKLISDELKDDPNKLPQHILSSINDSIQRAVKKNPAIDAGNFQSLHTKLEFADLRELQDVITGKTLWPVFQTRFSNKEQLIIKFDQLAELRNAIRHSRAVDEIKRKEGEAVILWFDKILKK